MAGIFSCGECTGEIADLCSANFERVAAAAIKSVDMTMTGEFRPDSVGPQLPDQKYDDPFSAKSLDASAAMHNLFVRGLIADQISLDCQLDDEQIRQRLMTIQGQ